jgi:hypothetical protein
VFTLGVDEKPTLRSLLVCKCVRKPRSDLNFVAKIWSNNMNMISTAFPIETDASNKTETLAKKFASVWEKKNLKTARAGGVS